MFIHAIGMSELLARILAAAGSMDYLFFSFMAYFVIERYGRRRVMMTSAAACCMCWTIIAIALGLSETGRGDSYKLGIVAVSFFFVFFASFAMGVLGVPWLYPTEVNALAFRAKGASLAMASNWIMNYKLKDWTMVQCQFNVRSGKGVCLFAYLALAHEVYKGSSKLHVSI